MKVKNDHRSKFSNLSNWKEEAWKNQGFNGIRTRDLPVTGALLYQLSYEATHWKRGQFIEFISPVRSEIISCILHITSSWLQITGFPLFFFLLLIHIGFISNGKAFATPLRWKVVERMFIRIFQLELHWTDSLHFLSPFWLNNTHLGVVWNISYLHNLRVRFFAKIQIRIRIRLRDPWMLEFLRNNPNDPDCLSDLEF